MLFNSIRKIAQQQLHRYGSGSWPGTRPVTYNIINETVAQFRHNTTGVPPAEEKQFGSDKRDDEIEAGLRIEASLFENSLFQHKPVIGVDLLKKSKAKPKVSIDSPPAKSPRTVSKKKERPAPPAIIDDPDLGLQFYRLKLGDPLLSTLLMTVRSRKRRDKNREILIEGRRLILEALNSNLQMHGLVFSDTKQLDQIKEAVGKAQLETGAKIYKVPQHDLKMWSTLSTPPGLMAIFKRPTNRELSKRHEDDSRDASLPITVICDNIREPNNLGSIMRICAALPCQQVIVMRGCCDPWESKALRGGCGGQFRLPIHDDVGWEHVPGLIPAEVEDDWTVFIAENNLGKLQQVTPIKGQPSPTVVDYADMGQTGQHNVVIIGGESHGVSKEAYEFLQLAGDSNRGRCVNIPVANGIDSLNVTSALTLVLYELRKRLAVTSVRQSPLAEDKNSTS